MTTHIVRGGSRGGVVGSEEAKYIWMDKNVETWVSGVNHLVAFEIVFP